EEVLRAGLIAFPLVVVAAALVSWWLVGRVLGPLHAVTATARRLSVESLDTRTGVRDARGEVAELAAGFDAMLERLQAAFGALRADATARGLRVLLRTAPAPTHGDPVLVERVVGNLLENAVRHNVAGGWLEVCTGPVVGAAADGLGSGPVAPPGASAGGGV